MPTFLRHFLIAALLIISAFKVSAQGDAAKTASIAFRVTRFDPNDQAPPVFHIGNGKDKTQVEIPMTHIAGPFKATLRDGIYLDFWGDNAEKPAISLEIKPTEHEHLLLVFFPDGETFRIVKVLASPTTIKGGDRFIINTTTDEIGIKLGDAQPLLIPSAKTGLLSAPRGDKVVTLPVVINQKQDGAWKLASTEDWPCDPRFRKYLIAYVSPRTRQLSFHSLSELSQ